jgi:5-methylcytosine-specific restriction endonuclease McrA
MCGEECKTHKSKFCSERCSSLHRKQETDKKIESNEKVYFRQIRRYLIEKHGEKCMECGWDKKNPITNTVPLDMDHIDGDHENNVLTNLKLLCPNCHSLTPTYKGLNRGHGRAERRKRYHNGQSF